MKGHLRVKKKHKEKNITKISKWYCKSKHMMDAIKNKRERENKELYNAPTVSLNSFEKN